MGCRANGSLLASAPMALLTTLLAPAADALLRGYGLELLSLTPLAAGSVNSNFFLQARPRTGGPTRDYFARLYEEQDEAGARFEVEVNDALRRAGQPVAAPVFGRGGEAVFAHLGKPFALYERLDGSVLCQKMVTPRAARSVGRALALVHRADLGGMKIPEGRFGFEGMLDRLERVEASGRTDLAPVVETVRRDVEALRGQRAEGLPSGLTHGDLFRDNVLISDETVTGLLDFESACRGPFIYDLMVTLLAWCYANEFEAPLVRALLEGYSQERPLSSEERAALVTEGCVACLRFVCTRLTDFSLRVPPGATPARHYGRFLRRMAELQSGALETALGGLL